MAQTTPQRIAPGSQDNLRWSIRPFVESDTTSVVHLFNAAWTADKIDSVYTEKDLRIRLASPNLDISRHVIVADGPKVEGVPEGTALGFGIVTPADDPAHDRRTYTLTVYAHPAAVPLGLEGGLLHKLLEITRAQEARDDIEPRGTVRLKATAYEKQKSLRVLWTGAGMSEVRQFWLMHRPLGEPIEEPKAVEGVIIRPYKRPDDNRPGVEAYNDSFIDHYDFRQESEAEWEFKASTPFFKPELSRMAEIEGSNGEIAGFCICAIFDQENKIKGRQEGWIALLGTRRSWRGKGLGRALLLHGLHALKAAGMQTAVLGVDTESLTGADRLYKSVGFYLHERTMHYECLLSDVAI
jgi:mycothiol synthase